MTFTEEKLGLGLILTGVMAIAWALTGHWPGLGTNFSNLVGGLLAIYGLFCGGSIGSQLIQGRNASLVQVPDPGQLPSHNLDA